MPLKNKRLKGSSSAKYIHQLIVAGLCCFLFACSASRKAYNPAHKFGPAQLQEDYRIFRSVLERHHPSLYWFTPKDSMDAYFEKGASLLNDSMTELEFRNVISYVISKIRCGHTSVRGSKAYQRYIDTARLPTFPLSLKVWPDSMAVVQNLNRGDSILTRGRVIRSVNGMRTDQLTDTLFEHMVTDGRAINGKYQALASRGGFGTQYRNLFGTSKSYTIEYKDRTGNWQTTTVPVFIPVRDTSKPLPRRRDSTLARNPQPGPPLLNPVRNIQIDTTLSSAFITLNSFAQGNHLRRFFRRSFRELDNRKIRHLVIDVRSNGGGDAVLAAQLTRYLSRKPFKFADSLYAVHRSGPDQHYIKKFFFYQISMFFISRKKQDGLYHFGYFERHYYKPRKKNHYDGDVYLLIGGNSFSATTLFAKQLQGQANVTLVGEETGGGSYGNSAWMIPDVKLPNTGLYFRLPLFRLVMDKDAVKEGRGIVPDVIVPTTAETIRRGIDPKVEWVRRTISRLANKPISQ